MKCATCKPYFDAVTNTYDLYLVELCPVHALTERLAEALREHLDSEDTCPCPPVLAEYDAARKTTGPPKP